jgi:hypothetical protein
MVFDAPFNHISVLLVEETGVSGENRRPAASHWQTLSHNVSSTPRHERDTNLQLGTDCICSYKCNYHTITATTALERQKDTMMVQYGLSLIQILDLDERNQVLKTNIWATYVSWWFPIKWLPDWLTM